MLKWFSFSGIKYFEKAGGNTSAFFIGRSILWNPHGYVTFLMTRVQPLALSIRLNLEIER